MRRLHREPRVLLLRLPQEMAQLAAVEGGLEGARERAQARRGVVVRRDVLLDQELPPFFVRTLPDKHGQSILYTSAEIIDCMSQRGGGPLRCLHQFEEPQLLHRNGSLPQALRGFGAIDDQGFLRRQRNQCALW